MWKLKSEYRGCSLVAWVSRVSTRKFRVLRGSKIASNEFENFVHSDGKSIFGSLCRDIFVCRGSIENVGKLLFPFSHVYISECEVPVERKEPQTHREKRTSTQTHREKRT